MTHNNDVNSFYVSRVIFKLNVNEVTGEWLQIINTTCLLQGNEPEMSAVPFGDGRDGPGRRTTGCLRRRDCLRKAQQLT